MQYDIEDIQQNNIILLNEQVELILRCLNYYCYSANYLFNRNKKYTSKEDEMQISMITDTYHQIESQYYKFKQKNKNIKKIS